MSIVFILSAGFRRIAKQVIGSLLAGTAVGAHQAFGDLLRFRL